MAANAIVIERFHFDEVRVPCRPGSINSVGLDKPLHRQPVRGNKSWGVQFDTLRKLVVTVRLSNGLEGIGEFYRDHNWDNVKGMAQLLLGLKIDDIALQSLPVGHCREYFGFECAMYDTYARLKGLRVVDLIGGPVRPAARISAWSSHRTVDEIGPLAARYRGIGYDTLKMKADLDDPVDLWCEEIKRHAPGMQVIFDPNMRWLNAGHVRPRLRRLEEVGNVLLLEDPMPHWMYQEYAELRQFSSIPIVLHVSPPYTEEGQTIHDAINAIKHGSVDGFNFNGGVDSFKRLDSLAVAAGMHCWHGSEIDLGVLEAMFIHNAVAAPSCVWPSDIFGRLLREHDLLKRPLRLEPPLAYLPEGPGLGVELDRDAIDRYKVGELTMTCG
jgi:muconate cycloisomerase